MVNDMEDCTNAISWLPGVNSYDELPVIEDDGITYAAVDMRRFNVDESFIFVSEKGIWPKTSTECAVLPNYVERTPYAWVYEVHENEQDFHECMSFIRPDDVWFIRNIRPLYL